MMTTLALRKPFHSLAPTVSEVPVLFSSTPRHSPYSHIRLLPSFKHLKSLLQLHARLIVCGFRKDNFTLTHLINSYSSFRKCDLARFVFDSAPNPGLIVWNSMIRAYTRSNNHREALELYHCMLENGLVPDKYTFTFVLKACTGSLDLQEGIRIHGEIAQKGLGRDVFIGTGLIDMFCKTGNLRCAWEVFEKMPKKDVVAWNAIIAGLSQSLDPYEALEVFRSMQLGGMQPSSVSLLNLFPAVCKLSDIKSCRSIHGYVVRRVVSNSVVNGMIDMYSKCGHVDVARRVFNGMDSRDDISWGTMMAGYAHNGQFCEVLELFYQIKRENLKINKVSAVSAVLAAAETRDLEKGKEVHDCAMQQGIDSDVLVATPIVTMYAKCGELEKSKQLFDGLGERDLVAWSALIAAFVQSGFPEEALSLFRDMQNENLKPNGVTLVSVLSACAEPSSLKLGKSIHCYAVKADIDSDVSAGTALVTMYAKCGIFSLALIIFNRMPHTDVVTWNALINGYAQIGEPYHAMEMFHKLRLSGMHLDPGTMVGVLPACALLDDLEQGVYIHGQIIKSGFESDYHVKNALIDMYAKCGSLSSAEFLFNETGFSKDEVSWNVMIAGYMQNGHAKEAISTFHRMKSENFRPNLVTLVSVLPAAAYLAALREGMSIHAFVVQKGFQSNTLIGNSLIDMYAKCGRLDFSQFFFDEMNNKDKVSWNALLAGYAIHGCGDRAIELFSLMQENNAEFDSVSFLSILSACRHAGLVEEGRQIFYLMREKHHLEPGLEHYACMVDLLGRAGLFDESSGFIRRMPIEPDAGVWGALLGACRMHNNVKLGEVALDNLVKLEPGNPAHYIVLSSIYEQSGRWGDAGSTRSKMNETGLKKTPGCSWVEIKNKVHLFRVGDKSHPEFESMGLLWNNLLKRMEQMGYAPDRSCVLKNVEEEDKELFLYSHSERLAITFALLNTEPKSMIQIVKNLRFCADCHITTKFISKIMNRKIIVRDATRFHHFEDGVCSCKDYW
ncbi:pentatricopeptide repeat-containing protein At2g39620 [Malania oleifera]|uniref:pentatricopeptide repeat-containing protein At2g39620 n=1 Tax=Malania oleifera TaxID=397392 RepID=UPI0025ADC702|nr:pentatricopeptide repeat-containing protein At2g39620 [Malania oleifera]XP_057979458.1 pentatricopeptide repeat-containing protein At2g39620 [Malania oleifera]